ncbi:2-oxo acid dehydrogenase subunit E2, partial [Streptomyces sp. TRM76130]|nr:2-oxo acid dehydrogenase subunit E2 [Streptomyces sp. TRM76130]
VEVPCPYGGVVTERFGEEGTEVPVGAPLLTVADGDRSGGGDRGRGGGGGDGGRGGGDGAGAHAGAVGGSGSGALTGASAEG